MKKIFYILFSIMLVENLMSQSLNDTIKIQEVEITAQKPLKEIAKSKTKIDSTIILETTNESMAELLSEHSPVFIKQAGRGALATISFRGTSASHTDVLWNDISIKSPMLGQVDFSLLPINFIDDVSLYAGGSSIEKSNGALGGAISIDNKVNWNDDKKIKLIIGLGSYQTTNNFLQFNLGKKQFKSRTRLFYNYSKNDFEFKNKNIADINPETGEYIYPIQRNDNADYKQFGLLQEFYYRTKSNINLSLKYWGQKADRNLPRLNTFEGDDYSNMSNQIDINHLFVGKINYYKNKSKITYIPAFAYQIMDYKQSNYISGLGYQNVVFSNSWSRSFYNKLKFNHKFNDKNELNFNIDYNKDYVSTEDTVRKQGYTKNRNEFVMFLSFNKRIKERLGISLMAKKYISGNYNMPISPFVGVEFLISKKQNISTKINISKNYKTPNLNDLYWQPGGNPELKPEGSLSTDLALLINKKYKLFKLKSSLTAFYSDVDNWIIWIPSPMGYWTPENIANVISQGIEYQLNIGFNINKFKILAIASYSYTDARNYGKKEIWGDDSYGKQLPYIPVHSGNIFVSISRWNYTLSYTHNSYSERYTTSSNDIMLRDWLYPYFMNNMTISKSFIVKKKYNFGVNFKIYNLFNEEYRSVLGRPMPGRNYLLSLKFEF